MTGQKHRSGGKRLRAGRFPQAFHISKKAARSLSVLTGHKKMLNPDMTSLAVLESLIYQAESDLNEMVEHNAERAMEGEEEMLHAATKEA